MDHRPEADERFAKLTALGCPECGLQVLSVDLAINLVWCGACAGTPLLERTAT
jgi:hypothetical protein